MEILKLINVRLPGKMGMQTNLGWQSFSPESREVTEALVSSLSSSPHCDVRTEAGQRAGCDGRSCGVIKDSVLAYSS